MVVAKIRALFKAYPVLANSAVYGTMCVTAEFSQQIINRKYVSKKNPPDPIDKASLMRYAVVGYGINSNMLYFWYKWLDSKYIGRAGKTVVKKLLLDQFVLTPHLLVIFYVSMSIMEGKKNILEECRQKILPTFQSSCCFWLPAQFINFLFVPPVARVVYVGTCSFIWVNILCWLKRKDMSVTELEKV